MAKGLLREDVLAQATALKIPAEHLYAVVDVETEWQGHLPDGRLKILFEPHIFFRELSKVDEKLAKDTLTSHPKHWVLCSIRRNPKLYGTYTESWDKLIAARSINEEAANKSASWGLFQIMGFNYRIAGFKSVSEMIRLFEENEKYQLMGFINVITSMGLIKALQRGDFTAFARKYNGPAYEENRYHIKMATKSAHYKKILGITS